MHAFRLVDPVREPSQGDEIPFAEMSCGPGWADENTSPTRKRGVEIIPRLRVGLVLTPLVQLLAAISSGQSPAPPMLFWSAIV